MFEVTPDHIAKLDDKQLRQLVVKLCEAELRRAGIPISSVTAGGHQNAPDGGLDVRVELSADATVLDFIPRPVTGFQVKCSDMRPYDITKEMSPKGQLRESIVELIAKKGAYIIVSSQGTVADAPLQARKDAMRTAAADGDHKNSVHLDFYDRTRLARWANQYPGVELWVRDAVNDSLSGWHPYGNWAPQCTPSSEYICDQTPRITAPRKFGTETLTVLAGIQAMRETLRQAGSIVRLIGLSGMGKTRLVQALFDDRLGIDSLDTALAVYTDQMAEPEPSARRMLERLGKERKPAVIVVDNCNPDLHRALATLITNYKDTLSLVTVEYDVADDEPELTDVFELTSASDEVLDKILQKLAPHVSQPDRYKISGAELAGGNARIALALANTLQSGESLGVLNDRQLFERLLHQRNTPGDSLMRAAEVLSLVYSFDGETLEGPDAELPILAALIGIPVWDLSRTVGQLKQRDLIQCRGQWRAVLPHAIANRLARQALENISIARIEEIFWKIGSERLLKSFSRRLSYLHDSSTAQLIATKWLGPDGFLAVESLNLNDFGMSLFVNLAHVAPRAALRRIYTAAQSETDDTFLSPDSRLRWKWGNLLRSLAYEAESFRDAAAILAKMRALETETRTGSSVADNFKELFQIQLSGTLAPVSLRAGVVRELAYSGSHHELNAALEALERMLATSSFYSSHDFSFGARSRGFGWNPQTSGDISDVVLNCPGSRT